MTKLKPITLHWTDNGFQWRQILKPSEITHVRSDRDYLTIFLTDGKELYTKKTMKTVAEEWRPHGFLRIHRSVIVNFKKIRAKSKEAVELRGVDELLPVGREYKKQLIALWNKVAA